MNWTKSIIGEIAFLETNANYKDSLKKVPKGCRIGTTLELLKLRIEDSNSLKNFPRSDYVLCDPWASWLGEFDDDSRFSAGCRVVDDPNGRLRGVFLVKKEDIFAQQVMRPED